MATKGDIQNAESLQLNVGQILLLVVMGAVASATMIIPGVSGSMVLMLLGYYTPVLNALNQLKGGVVSMEGAALAQSLGTLVPFAVGVVLGIVGVAKLIEWLVARIPTVTYCGVLGLVLASPVAILMRTDMSGVNLTQILVSIATFAVGFIAAMLLARDDRKDEKKLA